MSEIKSYRDQLIEVQEAITAVMSSQQYQLNGRMVTHASLHTLQEREKYLRGMVDAESRGGRRVRGITPS